ncbi:hypothetical protein VVD49_04635 [Uliginosibacterium sp. H3]|uniref:Uncharacterized protein n=1 Tax=Uliginosibacterium silvisoli TaxID=3114758 RepID=A0ABU6K0F8_9RHOO|nr:hypothetical protein [Uliginosibacterium sp. H3]
MTARAWHSPLFATFVAGLLSCAATLANAASFSGPDYSGVYDCKGVDQHEGPYSGTVTLVRNVAQSSGEYGAYDFKLEVPGYGTYPGQAVSLGKQLAIHFALTDPTPKDYGTGIATVFKDKQGRVGFRKFYYEPEFKGGNSGTETCVRRK